MPTTLTTEKIQEVAQTAHELIDMLSCGNKKAAWEMLARKYCGVVGGSKAAFLLVPVKNEETLENAGICPRKGNEIVQLPEGLAHKLWTAISLDPERIAWSPLLDNRPPESVGEVDQFLFGTENREQQTPTSTLWCVVRDRKNFVLGILVAARVWDEKIEMIEQKMPPPFATEDLIVASEFVERVWRVVETLRSLKLVRDLRRKIHEIANRRLVTVESSLEPQRQSSGFRGEVLEATLSTAMKIVRSQRGSVLAEKPAVFAKDKKKSHVPVKWGEDPDPIGGFEVDAADGLDFTDYDHEVLELVGRHTASDCALAEKKLDREELRDWENNLAKKGGSSEIALEILDRVIRDPQLRLNGGIVYRFNRRANILSGFEGIGLPRNLRDFPYFFRRDDQAAATEAFNDVVNPYKYFPTADDQRVNQKGRSDFNINGPIFAVPLGDADRFGSIVCWYANPRDLTSIEEKRIGNRMSEITRHGARHLQQALFAEEAAKRKEIHDWSAKVLRQMMQGADLNSSLKLICDGLKCIGFHRIRFYQFRYFDTLVGIKARGMEPWPEAIFDSSDPGKDAYETRIDNNDYTRLVYQGVCRARQQSENAMDATDLLARLFPIKDKEGKIHEDSSRHRVGKLDGMPWVEAPIISAGKFFGILVADTRFEDQPYWGEISDVDLDAMDMFAQLAGRAFAMAEKQGMLIQNNLAKLDDAVRVSDSANSDDLDKNFLQVVRRILLFAAHGEEGLAFNRVLYFEPPASPGGKYRFVHGVGSASGKTHDALLGDKEKNICRIPLTTAFAKLTDPAEEDNLLNTTLKDFEIDGVPQPQAQRGQSHLPRIRKTDKDTPAWFQRLQELIEAEDVFVAPLLADSQDMGILIADRPFTKDYGMIDADGESLKSFARHAAHILLRHRSLDDRLRDLQTLMSSLHHELDAPLHNVRTNASKLGDEIKKSRQKLEPMLEYEEIKTPMFSLEKHLGVATEYVEALFEITAPFERNAPKVVSFADFLDELLVFKHSMKDSVNDVLFLPALLHDVVRDMDNPADLQLIRIKTEIEGISGVKVNLRTTSFRLALRNVFRNAHESFVKHKTADRIINVRATIDVSARTGKKQVLLSILDRGEGVPPEGLPRLREWLPNFTTKYNHRGGVGLCLSKLVVRKHNGEFEVRSEQGRFFEVVIRLPVVE